MSLFDKKKSFSRREFRDALSKDAGTIPGSGGQRYSGSEREKMGREIFGQKYGSNISKDDYRKAVQGLESAKRKTENRSEKGAIDRKIKYLRGLGGKNL